MKMKENAAAAAAATVSELQCASVNDIKDKVDA